MDAAKMTVAERAALITGLEQNIAAAERDAAWRTEFLQAGKVVPSAQRRFRDQVAVDEYLIAQQRAMIALLRAADDGGAR